MRTLRRDLPGIVYPVSASATPSGASPLAASTTGVASGDLCFFAASTTNSILDVAGPEGGGWTQLWTDDLSASDEVACWYKVADGSEPSTWDWTHSAGSLVNGLMLAFRGPSFIAATSARTVSTALARPGIGRGGQTLIHIMHEVNGGDPAFDPAPDYASTGGNQYTAAWVEERNPWPIALTPLAVDATAGIGLNRQGLILVG